MLSCYANFGRNLCTKQVQPDLHLQVYWDFIDEIYVFLPNSYKNKLYIRPKKKD